MIGARQRQRAAEALREGASHAEAAKAAGIGRRSISNLLQDPMFAALVRGEMVVTEGIAPFTAEHADVVDPLDRLPGSEAWFTEDGEMLGSALNPQDEVVHVSILSDPDRIAHVRSALRAGKIPDPALELEPPALAPVAQAPRTPWADQVRDTDLRDPLPRLGAPVLLPE